MMFLEVLAIKLLGGGQEHCVCLYAAAMDRGKQTVMARAWVAGSRGSRASPGLRANFMQIQLKNGETVMLLRSTISP